MFNIKSKRSLYQIFIKFIYRFFNSEYDALKAFQLFNGRFYSGKQISCSFVKINFWREAICGMKISLFKITFHFRIFFIKVHFCIKSVQKEEIVIFCTYLEIQVMNFGTQIMIRQT